MTTSYLFNIETRTDSEILASLLEYGIGASFDLKAWSLRARDCSSLASVNQRLQLLLEPVRCATAKLITMQALEHDESREHLRDECVYGEINPGSFKNTILDRVSLLLVPSHPHPNDAPALTFYDLGSGTGKNVFVAALSGLFVRAVGIEILPELASISTALNESFVEDVVGPGGSVVAAATELRMGSFLIDTEWVETADVVFCNCVMFDGVTMHSLSTLAKGMKRHSLFITLGQTLNDEARTKNGTEKTSDDHELCFEIIDTFDTDNSWGSGVDTFIHRRV